MVVVNLLHRKNAPFLFSTPIGTRPQGAQPKNESDTASIKDKKEAKIIFSLPTFEVKTSHNVSSIVDNGSGNITVVFTVDFPDKNYYANVTGDKAIAVKKITKERGSVRIEFEEKDLELVEVVCAAA